ncbi:uncharacterized protein LOC114534770 [Dendronephthya gigantea]|uniref:uncharacterized protein LOC114534770 n=1 Tax=Dendronephthya gigantea TaxID=151771 RepID=UPI00106DAEED|nr:uncharacterized protein LOC114534770 [Dendronephthya gigantea]
MTQQQTNIDWKSVTGAFRKPRRLHLERDKEGFFHCPTPNCDHQAFTSQRGCQKHVEIKHPWYTYFQTRPILGRSHEITSDIRQFDGKQGEDEQFVLSTVELVDYFLCSSRFLTDFLDHLESVWQMGQSGHLGYVNGIKLTEPLSILVFQAIGKYIHPTRYRQIIEKGSASNLDVQEQRFVWEDLKHSSNIARVHYQKLRSCNVL